MNDRTDFSKSIIFIFAFVNNDFDNVTLFKKLKKIDIFITHILLNYYLYCIMYILKKLIGVASL